MLKKIEKKAKRKTSKLRATPGENVRDAIIKAGLKTAEKSAYKAGNLTERVVEAAEKISPMVDRGVELFSGGESSAALGKIAFKTTKDISRGDKVCTGLCLISVGCEAIALSCSTIKIIPFRGQIYVGAKIVSRGCMSFRNACVGEGC